MQDVIVIGGGPGGYLAAERAGHAGLSVTLIEKKALGGVCLNEGCVPSKALLNSAKLYEHARDSAAFGVITSEPKIDQQQVIKRKNKVVKQLVAGVASQMKANHVTVKMAEARILGRENGIIRVQAGDEVLEARNLILATGSEAIVPPIPGVQEGLAAGTVLTNREILDLTVIPKNLVVVGGGVIGLEMASYYQMVGSKVTVIEMLDHIAGNTDREISTLLQRSYEKKGMTFKLGARVTAVKADGVEYELAGQTHTEPADYVLLSIGRRPVTRDIGLESLNLYLEHGHVVTDRQCRTNIPNVYAVGDINGIFMLAHAAYREAEVAVNTLLGKKDTMRYDALPSVIYTQPEVASVGMSEEEVLAAGLPYQKVTIPFGYSGRFLAETERENSLCKLLVDTDRNRLIGCHLLGPYSSEIIIAAGMMIELELTLNEIKEFIFPHPTVAEIIREAIFLLK